MLSLIAQQAADASVTSPGIVNTGVNVTLLAALFFVLRHVFTKTIPDMQTTFAVALDKVLQHCLDEATANRETRHESGNEQHEQHLKNVVTLQEHTTEIKNLANRVRENTESIERIAGSRAVLP
jgi:esterase/lipase